MSVPDIASAATITLRGTGIYRITGTTQIDNIEGVKDGDMVALLPAGVFAIGTGGNIEASVAASTAGGMMLFAIANGSAYQTSSTIPASLPPSGPAGGDLAGTYPNPTVAAAVVKRSATYDQVDLTTQFGCSAYSSTLVTVPTATDTAIGLDFERYDRGGCHDNVTNNSRITIPTGGDGIWLFVAQLAWQSSATGVRTASLFYNGAVRNYTQTIHGGVYPVAQEVSAIMSLAAGNYVELYGNQDSGGNLVASGTLMAHKLA